MTKAQSGFVFGTAHAGLVLTLLLTFVGYLFIEKNRAEDIVNARVSALETSLRNCSH